MTKSASTCFDWAKELGWPAWVPQGNGMLLWSASEDGEERDLCASIAVSNGEVRATVSLQYLGESINIATFYFGSDGASGSLIGGMEATAQLVAQRIRMHIEHCGDPILIECERARPEVPAYLARETAFIGASMEFV